MCKKLNKKIKFWTTWANFQTIKPEKSSNLKST